MSGPELEVVVPVYNEEGAVERVLREWLRTLRRLEIDFQIHACNDGSTDRTAKILGEIAREEPRISVHNQENSGHGPTILAGYRASESEWVFQIDSDDELGSEGFVELWRRREAYDFLLGGREARVQAWPRRVISLLSRLTVRLAFGPGIRDVNSPYRLVRGPLLRRWAATIPSDTFAPNLVLSGLACREGVRILELEVPHRDRRTGTVSIRRWKLARAAARSFLQTLACRWRLRR